MLTKFDDEVPDRASNTVSGPYSAASFDFFARGNLLFEPTGRPLLRFVSFVVLWVPEVPITGGMPASPSEAGLEGPVLQRTDCDKNLRRASFRLGDRASTPLFHGRALTSVEKPRAHRQS
jgi:hypothetical protein